MTTMDIYQDEHLQDLLVYEPTPDDPYGLGDVDRHLFLSEYEASRIAVLCAEIRLRRQDVWFAVETVTLDAPRGRGNRPHRSRDAERAGVKVKSIAPRSEVRKTIQATVFRSLGFDIGFQASAAASDAVFNVLAERGIIPDVRGRLVELDPIEELRGDNPTPPPDGTEEDGAVF